MATLKTNSIDIIFSYHELNDYGFIDYTCDCMVNRERLFNSAFYDNNQKGFIFSLNRRGDIFIDFFVELFNSRQGKEVSDGLEGLFSLKAETWLDKKEETMENWKDKTVWTGDEDNLKQEDYTSVMNELFVPGLENQLKLTLSFSPSLFPFFQRRHEVSNVTLIADTDFDRLALFTADMIEEQKKFLPIYKKKLSFLKEQGRI